MAADTAISPAAPALTSSTRGVAETARVLTPDLCVIGAGSGGLSVAAAAAALGVDVVLIEKGRMGGDCLNTGCVPSKALIAAAKRAYQMRNAAPFGIEAQRPVIDHAAVRAHVRATIDAIAPNDSAERFRALGVVVINAAAAFVDKRTVEAGDVRIRARRFVIATGSSPALPPIAGLDTVPYLTSDSVFDLAEPIGHLVVIGGGPIGLELAQAHRRLGAQVTVLEAGRALAKEDPELAGHALGALRAEGIEIAEAQAIASVSGVAGRVLVRVTDGAGVRPIEATHLLVATGRTPNIEGLGLDAARVRTSKSGIVVDQRLGTSNRRVMAIGDVAGGPQFTHAANQQAGLVIRRALFRLRVRFDAAQVPRVTFTDPEIAVAGLDEAEARRRHGRIVVYRWPFSENDRSVAERTPQGLVKVVCTPRGRILGAGIVGANAGELIHVWSLAVSQGLSISAMANCVVPYPTRSEVSRRAALTSFAVKARDRRVRGLLAFLRRFG